MRTSESAIPLQLQADPACLEVLARVLERTATEAPDRLLSRKASAGEAFQAIAASCLSRFWVNEDLLARTGDAEALHHARVALRQLRSALSIFRPIVADNRFDHLQRELRWLASAMNQ